MFNQIVDAVAKTLKELFPEAGIVTDPLREGKEKPCFEVGITQATEKQVNSNRYFRSVSVSVKYYSEETQNVSRERNRILDVLMDKLEYVIAEDGSSFRGSSRSGKIEGGVLDFLLDYQIYILKSVKTEESMEEMKLT